MGKWHIDAQRALLDVHRMILKAVDSEEMGINTPYQGGRVSGLMSAAAIVRRMVDSEAQVEKEPAVNPFPMPRETYLMGRIREAFLAYGLADVPVDHIHLSFNAFLKGTHLLGVPIRRELFAQDDTWAVHSKDCGTLSERYESPGGW